MSRVDSSLDLRLFQHQVGWAAEEMRDRSLIELARWICVQIRRSDDEETQSLARLLIHLLRMDAPEQHRAEDALIDALQHRFYAQVPRRVLRDEPRRNVDWSDTYRRALTGTPTTFVSQEVEQKPDRALMGALVYQAHQWRDMLGASEKSSHQERADALDAASKRHLPTLQGALQPLSPPLMHRLRQNGTEAYRLSVLLNRVFAQQHTRPERLISTIRKAIDEADGWWSSEDADSQNAWNGILEFSILTAITRVADMSPNWALDSIDTDKTYQAHLTHTDAPLRLTVQKSPPGADAFKSIRKRAGMAKYRDARDSQPDICLTFTHTGTEASVSVLGDAKRNATGDHGGDYLYSSFRTAPYYMSAFADALGLHVDKGEPVGAIRPTFTLFFRQGIEAPHPAREALANGDAENVPPILAFDIEHHLGLKASDPENNSSWSAPILEDWLACITRQARDRLCEGA